jgi:hypothetical protein
MTNRSLATGSSLVGFVFFGIFPSLKNKNADPDGRRRRL